MSGRGCTRESRRITQFVPVVPTNPPAPTPPLPPPPPAPPGVPTRQPGFGTIAQRLIAALAVTGIGGGSLALALRQGAQVEEQWGTQISVPIGSTVQAKTIATDSAANVFAGGEYESVLTVTTTGSTNNPSPLTASGRIGGYVIGMQVPDGKVNWMLNIETDVANSDGASVSSIREYNGDLFVAGSYDTLTASASILSPTGATVSSPTTLQRSKTEWYSGIFVLGFKLSNFIPSLEWTFTSSVYTNTVERNVKIDTNGTTVYTGVSEQSTSGAGRNTRIMTLSTTGSGVQTSVVLSGSEFKNLAYVRTYNAATGYLAVLMDTTTDSITANVTRADGTFTVSTIVGAIPNPPASIILALSTSDFSPQWMMSVPNANMEINDIASDDKSGVYFVGTHRVSTKTVLNKYAQSGTGGLTVSATTVTLDAVTQKSNIFVGHLKANGAFDANFFPAQTPIGGFGEDIGHSIDFRDNRLSIGGAVEGEASILDGVFSSNQRTQSVVVSVDPTTGYPNWAAVIAQERDNTAPFDVAIVPQVDSAGKLNTVLTGSFTGSFDYRTITMTAKGSQDGYILPATAP